MPLLPYEEKYWKKFHTHSPESCAGSTCVVHNPSNHHMREWPLNYRLDTKMTERICKCGVGHPDPDAAAFHEAIGASYLNVHGCCGCCSEPHKIQ